jgi:uncharacterized membrane protein
MIVMRRFWVGRVVAGHPRVMAGLVLALAAYPLLPHALGHATRAVLAWDIGSLLLLMLAAILFFREGSDAAMAENAKAQEEGEWTAFWIVIAGVAISFVALTQELGNVKDAGATVRGLHIGLVAATLVLSWLVTQVVFALRYAHEYYTTTGHRAKVDGGLEFPGTEPPDYWDFLYFSMVLGMTFQVSDVQITSRKLRRLATVHGFIGFLFNTVIIALTVNIASGLMG